MSARGRKAPSRKKAAPAKKGPAPSTRRKAPAAKRPAAAKKKAPATRSRPRSKTAPVRPLTGQECSYSSVTFRSQLEARWAVFFDALAIDWDRASGAGPVLQGGGSRVMTGGVQGSVTGVLARIYEA